MAEHIALLGDSIFDNASYTKGLPDVVTHLRGLLPAGVKASLVAIDGSTTADLGDQVNDLPSDVTRVVLSIGGNNALLMLFNDVILRAAFHWRLPVIDLRLVCSEPSDYANPIEPSGSGGAKIARAIAATLGEPGETSASRVFAG